MSAERPVLDPISYQAAEVNRLEAAFPVSTAAGAATLHHSIINGLENRTAIAARQEAVEELGANDTLRGVLAEGLATYAKHEGNLTEFVGGDNRSYMYQYMRSASQSLRKLERAIPTDGGDAPQTLLMRQLVHNLGSFNGTRAASHMRGPLYYTPAGVRSGEEKFPLMPFFRFRPGFSGRILAANALAMYGVSKGYIPLDPEMAPVAAMPVMFSMMYGGAMAMPGNEGHRGKDYMWSKPTMYKGLRNRINDTPEFAVAMATTGELDVLTATAGLRKTIEANGHRTVFPTIGEPDVYHFDADNIKNPLLATEAGRALVANSITLGGDNARLTFLTGPNSGGKSTISKAVVQNQVLGQMGAPVVADRADMSIADSIAYHVPTPPDLDEETGRFGFELRRVREILDNASTESLTVLDDCLDGTTHEERLEVLKNIMYAYRFMGGATLFSTHAHEMVGEFEQHGEGQLLQVEFANDRPTYRVVPGVSHTSHADNVARLYGFTRAQVAKELADKGHPETDWL
jgi:DNA mismatch repair ATPase MutS